MSSGRRQYPFDLIEPKWQQFWEEQQTFRAFNPGETIAAEHPFGLRHGLAGKAASAAELPPKFYILDMFPYPSGAGLHVGHPEGYTATDILARYRRAAGRHVLHPMGWDAFGLPAEQYAVKTGQHPRVTTEANIANFTKQIKSLGFSYDWSREVDTTDPEYFKWTQWIFLKLYNSWFNPETNRAEPIETLKYPAELDGARLSEPQQSAQGSTPSSNENAAAQAARCGSESRAPGDLEARRRAYRDSKRLAYVSEAPVWWCEELGTVLANEEVVDGKSEVGGFPVTRKPMRQWMLRITAYAEKLLNDLDIIDWSDSLKEMQRNWIGRSEGAEVQFEVADDLGGTGYQPVSSGDSPDGSGKAVGKLPTATGGSPVPPGPDRRIITVFTTRPDTLFGATYMVLAPEHKLVDVIVPKDESPAQARAKAVPMDTFMAKAAQFGAEHINLAEIEIPKEAIAAVPAHIARRFHAMPFYVNDEAIGVVITDPADLDTIDVLHSVLGKCLEVRVATYSEISKALDRHYGPTHRQAVDNYRAAAAAKSDLERTELAKEKTGVFTGAYAINPVNGERIPIWIADYVLASYGTGAIMAVPGHDERDFEFAKKFNLPIEQVVVRGGESEDGGKFASGWTTLFAAITDEGLAINSQNSEISLNGLPTAEAKAKITRWLEEKGLGKKTINYKLRDWLFSRQRYWGEPFPIVWKRDAQGNEQHEALPESALPLLPPRLDDYKPTKTGEPPLARAQDWVNLPDGSRREVNTMPQWAGSCWYYLRYLDARNGGAFVAEEAERYWMGVSNSKFQIPNSKPATPGVDLYVGGTEHAVLHLLYARFWHKVLYDLGHVSTPEPFFKLVNQGLILGEDGQKMSKSRGNVVNPDDILREYGADAFRLYEMFMGPLEMTKPWNTKGVEGVYRFLGRVWRLFVDEKSETAFEQALTMAGQGERGELLDLIVLDGAVADVQPTKEQLKVLHACIKKVTEDLEAMRFNTAISAMMVFTNEAIAWQSRPFSVMRTFLQLLAPFAPHLAEELWARLHRTFGQVPPSLTYAPWPAFDAALLVEDTVEIAVQVNGKVRDRVVVSAKASKEEIEVAALKCEGLKPFLEGKSVKKIIVVPGRLVNIAVA